MNERNSRKKTKGGKLGALEKFFKFVFAILIIFLILVTSYLFQTDMEKAGLVLRFTVIFTFVSVVLFYVLRKIVSFFK